MIDLKKVTFKKDHYEFEIIIELLVFNIELLIFKLL